MKNKNNNLVGYAKIIVLLLCVLSAVSCIITFPSFKSISKLIDFVVACLTIYYVFAGYKKPHGDLLRYLFIVFTLEYMFDFWYHLESHPTTLDISKLLCMISFVITAYVSGRLNKFKENIVLLCIAIVLSIITNIHAIAVINIVSPLEKIVLFCKTIILIALTVSYIARYHEHKEAGLEDKK